MVGVYIHVPFCLSKCRYCDFYSVTALGRRAAFVDALCLEIEARSYELESKRVSSIYWGGGTPSLLSSAEIARVMALLRNRFVIDSNAEITMECNPGDYDEVKMRQIIALGINRFSIGVQSFDAEVLKFLGRRHTAQEAEAMVRSLQYLGIDNISLDLIFGIPNTTIEMLQRDLDCLLALTPAHVSIYHLIYEEGTPLYADLMQQRCNELPEETSVEMQHAITERLTKAGFERYEISNYALPQRRARHNTSYWLGVPYVGFGPGAHSYTTEWRSYNPSNLEGYISSLQQQRFLMRSYEEITPKMAYEELILTRLRTADGLHLKEIQQFFGARQAQQAKIYLESYLASGHLYLTSTGAYACTPSGFDINDAIIASLF